MLRQLKIVLLLSGLFFTVTAYAQTAVNETGYVKEWRTIDSLADQGLPVSAQALTEKILTDAQKRQDRQQALKAKIYLLRYKYSNVEDGTQGRIREIESYIAHTEGVERAIWQSLAADAYRNFYDEHRYEIYRRTPVEGETSGDINTWSADAFTNRIAQLYEASLQQRELLQSTPVADYKAILTEGVHTASLRPALYDLLVFRALGFFTGESATAVKPVDDFQVGGSLWYEPAARFSEVKIKVKDASSFNFRTLRLFQDILSFHLKDAQPDALIDADLQRLSFVHGKSTNPANDSLYVKALKDIIARYPGHPGVAQALYLVAQQQRNEAENVGQRSPSRTLPGNKTDLREIKKQLDAIVSRFPGTEGALNAARLIRELTEVTLHQTLEQVYIPNENIKLLLNYKNLPVAHFALYKVPYDYKVSGKTDVEFIRDVVRKKGVFRSWQQALPQSEDMREHCTELKVEALSAGTYALVVSDEHAGQLNDSSRVELSVLAVSGNALVTEADNNKGYALDRKTGQPLPEVKAFFFGNRYQDGNSKKFLVGQAVSDKEGVLQLPKQKKNDYQNSIQGVLMIAGADSLWMESYFGNYYRSAPDTASRINTYFFTDRSIYRPGQTLYFKGITVKSSAGGRQNETLAGKDTKVVLVDANGKEQASLQLKSNEYGSFAGSFVLPQGGMTGMMYVRNESGTQSFSVEEYKRPRFYVDFDTIKGSYALGQTVSVKGVAKAYAGSAVSDATVKYRVVRRTRFPYYWCYYYWGMPPSPQTEIANGTAVTKADGSFEISFDAVPDAAVAKETLPLFRFEITADVTDVNGETRSGRTGLNAGYNGIQIKADMPEDASPAALTQLNIRTTNLNDVFVPASVSVSIARLESPGFLRTRLWQAPDVYTMTESEFRAAFPGDEYKEESNYLNWEKEKTVFEKQWTTTGQSLQVPENIWSGNGRYVVEIKTKDTLGNEVTEKKYVYVWAPGRKEDKQAALAVHTSKSSYEPGEKLELWLNTAAAHPYLLRKSGVAYKGDENPLRLTIEEKDRGGITFMWLYVWNSRVYTVSKIIDIPWTNKELQVEWATHRDKLQPGATEQWTLTLKGKQQEKVAAELLAGMYDASLDAFRPHNWRLYSLFPSQNFLAAWNSDRGFGTAYPVFRQEKSYDEYDLVYEKEYGELIPMEERPLSFATPAFAAAERTVADKAVPAPTANFRAPVAKKGMVSADAIDPGLAQASEQQPADAAPPARKNLQETAFFFPQLKTDAAGNVSFSFTMPEALTEWKLMAFAHTSDMKTGYLEGSVKTQKDLMVMPNLPRFLRQGDDIRVSTKISNLADKDLSGSASIELVDAITLQPIPLSKFQQRDASAVGQASQSFVVKKGLNTSVTWQLHVPESMYTPVIVRITARSGNFTDGEENTLPVVTNRTLVTETLPLTVNGGGSKDFTLDKLVNNNSNTLVNRGLTVEFTGNPAWYAVQALPYLMEYPYECAEQTFNRLYANALAGHIVGQSPKMKQVFEQWQQKDTAAFASALQKNEDLKLTLLEETPWVMEAQDEQEQKKRIALLFQAATLARQYDRALQQLQRMQLPDGSFPWFSGMNADRFITQYILTGLGRLEQLGVKGAGKKEQQAISAAALNYADAAIGSDYNALLKTKAKLEEQQISGSQVQYLYMRSFFPSTAVKAADEKAYQFYQSQAARYWNKFNPYLKAQLALALNRAGNMAAARQVLASLKETAIRDDVMGMYWKDMPRGYSWSEAPIEAQAVLIEAFAEIGGDNAAVEQMKLWLLRQKQTQHWNTTKATADACYALLLTGGNWIASTPDVHISAGSKTIEAKGEAGSGYFSRQFGGSEISNDMGHIKVTVQPQAGEQSPVSWGAVYWQYFEDMSKVTASAAGPLSLKRTLYIEKNSPTGPVLTEIRDGNQLKVGDKVKVRIEVKADRDMEYVQLKDSRASCFEPVDVLSQYKYQSGTGYFQSTRDLATHFFFDRLRKGTYVFEYAVWVNAAGSFNNGVSSIQCMYAPEFAGHSTGIRVKVE